MSLLLIAWRFLTAIPIQVWIIIAALIALAAFYGHGWSSGYAAAESKWIAKQLEAKIAKLELEKKALEEAAALDKQFRDELAAENEQQEKVIDAFLEENAKRTDRCPLGDDAGKLNGL